MKNDQETVLQAMSYLMDRAHMNALDHGFHAANEPLEQLTDVLVEKLMPHLTINEWLPVVEQIKQIRRQTEMRDDATALMLIVSEVGEAVEALRTGSYALHAEELADVCIRVFDYCGKHGIDLGKFILHKMEINETRPLRHGKVF